MSISVQCRHCGQRYKVSPTTVGRKIACQKCQALIEVVSSDDLLPPPAGSLSSKSTPRPTATQLRPGAQPPVGPPAKTSELLPPKAVAPAPAARVTPTPAQQVSAPIAQPIGMVEESAPAEQAVEFPAIQVAPAPVAPSRTTFEPVRASTVEELLDEQDRADRDHFRGLRRRFRHPPNLAELLTVIVSHKLLTAISVFALFFVLDYLRGGQLLFALVFGSVALGLVLAGSQSELGTNMMFQAAAWCYLVVLFAFPVALRYQDELGLAGSQILKNPTMVAVAPSRPPAQAAVPPPRAAVLPNSDAAQLEQPTDETAAPTEQTSGEPETAPRMPSRPNVETTKPASKPLAARPEPPPPVEVPVETTEAPAAIPRSAGELDALLQNAEKAFGMADPATALQFLYTDALSHADSEVWRFVRWSKPLGRPVIAIRWGAALEMDDLASQATGVPIGGGHANAQTNLLENQKLLGTTFVRNTLAMGGPVVVTWLRSCYDEGRFGDVEIIRSPTVRDLRGATYLAADTPAEILRAARAQQLDFLLLFSLRGNVGAKGPTASASIRVVDVTSGRELHATKPKAAFNQIRKEVDATLELLNKEMILEDVPKTIDAAAVQARLKVVAKKTDNPLGPLAELLYYHREKRLPEKKVAEIMGDLIGADDAKSMLEGTDRNRQQVIARWIPKAPR